MREGQSWSRDKLVTDICRCLNPLAHVQTGELQKKFPTGDFCPYPLSSLSAIKQVRLGDVVVIDVRQTQKPAFFRDRSEVSLAAAALESARRARAEITYRGLMFTGREYLLS